MVVGLGLVGVLTATVASFFVEERTDSLKADLAATRQQLDRIEKMLVERGSVEPFSCDG